MFLSFLLYPLHLWCVNMAVGAPLMSLWLERRCRDDEDAWHLHCHMARAGWIALVAGGCLGAIHGVLIWDGQWSAKVHLVSSRIGFAAVEFVTSLLLMIAHWYWLRRTRAPRGWWHVARWLLPLIAGTNLLYHFPTLFAVLRHMDLSQYAEAGRVSSAEFRQLLISPRVAAGWLHFTLSCFAVTGVAGILLGLKSRCGASLLRPLALVSCAATLLQWVSGPVVLICLPREAQFQLTGMDPVCSLVFLLALVLVFVLTIMQFRLVRHPTSAPLAGYTMLLQLAVITAMSAVDLQLLA